MPLKKQYIRDGRRQLIGSVTSGLDSGHQSVIRDDRGRILGRASTRFQETRDSSGRLVSTTTADPGLLFRRATD